MKSVDVWNDDCAPMFCSASSGAGKFVSDISIMTATYMGSALWATVKEEIANFSVGRNVDMSPRFRAELLNKGLDPGVDPSGQTTVRKVKPRFRSFLVDPYHQTPYAQSGQDCSYTFMDEMSDQPEAGIPYALALAEAAFPDKEGASTDPFFTMTPRSLFAGGFGHAKTQFPPELQNLPAVADFLMGKVPGSGAYSPEQFRKNLVSMMSNPSWGGFIASTASKIAQLSDRTFGACIAELGNGLQWVMEPAMRKHLTGVNRFKYADMGDDRFPMTVFVIPSRIASSSSEAFMRAHIAAFIAARKPINELPTLPIVAGFDEAAQYLHGAAGRLAAKASLVLRSSKVKQIQYWQSPESARRSLGEASFNEYIAQATLRFYGVRTIEDARWISEILGERTTSDGVFPLASPQTILRELAITSPLQYVLPYSGPPVQRLLRRGYKTIRTNEGLYLKGLPLDGHYDEF